MTTKPKTLTCIAVACLFGSLTIFPTFAGKTQLSPIMIDDFEDGDLNTNLNSPWHKISDKIAGGASSVKEEIIDGGGGGTKKSLRISGALTSDFKYGPFAGLGTVFDSSGKNLTAYTGIRFYARGDGGTYNISVTCAAVKDHNEFGKSFVAGKTWQLHSIRFSELAQNPGWGRQVKWTGTDIRGIDITASGDPRNFTLDIDQISFY